MKIESRRPNESEVIRTAVNDVATIRFEMRLPCMKASEARITALGQLKLKNLNLFRPQVFSILSTESVTFASSIASIRMTLTKPVGACLWKIDRKRTFGRVATIHDSSRDNSRSRATYHQATSGSHRDRSKNPCRSCRIPTFWRN